MKTHEYFPTLFYAANHGVVNGILIVISFAMLLLLIWSICSLSEVFLGAVRGIV
jgi:hypothetical protein